MTQQEWKTPLLVTVLCGFAAVPCAPGMAGALSLEEALGKSIFFDAALSIGGNQSCAACHDPEWGGTGPDATTNAYGAVYEGSIPGRFGNRKPPSSAYATMSPILHVDPKAEHFVGGNFWDGRATGEKLGNPAADQAQGPFLNPAEQALPDSACVVYKVCTGAYAASFMEVYGADSCAIAWPAAVETLCVTEGVTLPLADPDRGRSDTAYDNIALAIASYEASAEVNAFSSKYDHQQTGPTQLGKQERRGLALFRGKAKCSRCHTLGGKKPLFTDFTFDNLGIPKNPENPVYASDPGFVDLGLGAFLEDREDYKELAEENMGKHKVPTLRNVDKRPVPGDIKAFGHNGYFKSLKGIVHFYNTRDVKPVCPGDYTEAEALAANCWPPPEVGENVNDLELGNLGLSGEEEDAIVAFLRTLSDGFVPAGK